MIAYRRLSVQPVSGALGAEVSGADLARLDDETVTEIRRAFLEHLVLFFRDQRLDREGLKAVSRLLGPLSRVPYVAPLPEDPDIIAVRKEAEERNISVFGGAWHSDFSFLAEPPLGSALYAIDVPAHGGDTLFANMYAAYDALSDGMKRMLDPLYAVNSSAKADVTRTREDRLKTDGSDKAGKELAAEHPVVRTHPETGRKALYVNFAHTARFRGMTEQESAPLLNFLFQHQVRPEFTCRFTWRVGSLALWDNRCAQHNPVNDYHGYKRLMHRITLEGDRPA